MFFERRQFERFNFEKELIIAAKNPIEKKEVQFYAKTINISRGGMLFFTIAQFKPKTKCWVKFKTNSYKGMELKGKILRVVEENRPEYLKESEVMYALEFDEVFSDYGMEEILKKVSEASRSK
ncbi:MAG: PilZ domain-containing protein [Spirochaetia bacterium]|nr:PilZ domain-containing protein [Spirochaetia bacterium]